MIGKYKVSDPISSSFPAEICPFKVNLTIEENS
jgi:hypothetical protein